MKSEKITESDKPTGKRWYDDACGTALALEFVGERWSLLVIRELMFGPRRFGELKANLPGISANVLTQRLEGLESGGILVRRKLPSPANVQVYELTPWGLEIEPIFQTMGRWATRSLRHDPTLFLSAASAMLSLRTMIATDKARGLTATFAFRFNSDAFVGELRDGDLAIRRGDTDADVTFLTDPSTLAAVIYGKRPFAEVEAEGNFRISGDRALAQAFVDLFALPEKIA
ncbi:MAG: transcriptional regulator [Rhizorhabdus sp.]|nr:transcriptional regulator [Rhizorhabdus sp.]